MAACCGGPGYLGWPIWQQYPASAHLPTTVSDLRLQDDAGSRRTAQQLTSAVLAARPLADDVFAGVYTDQRRKRVTVFGATGFHLRPDQELAAEFDRLTAEYALRDVQVAPSDVRGGHLTCGIGRGGGGTVVVCGRADHGSLLTGVFTRRSVDDSADLLRRLHPAIVTAD